MLVASPFVALPARLRPIGDAILYYASRVHQLLMASVGSALKAGLDRPAPRVDTMITLPGPFALSYQYAIAFSPKLKAPECLLESSAAQMRHSSSKSFPTLIRACRKGRNEKALLPGAASTEVSSLLL
jgi:hypothetical protein